MRPEIVIGGGDLEEFDAYAYLYCTEAVAMAERHLNDEWKCARLAERMEKAREMLERKQNDPEHYDEKEESELNLDFPLCYDEKDAEFANMLFWPQEILRIQCERYDEVDPASHAGDLEPCDDPEDYVIAEELAWVREGFLLMLRMRFDEALALFRRVEDPSDILQDIIRHCEEKDHAYHHCVSHPDRVAVSFCESCRAPICESCRRNNRIYSQSAEESLPYCESCYGSSVSFVVKHGRS